MSFTSVEDSLRRPTKEELKGPILAALARVEVIDRRECLSVQDWIKIIDILEDSNRKLSISWESRYDILKIVNPQLEMLRRLKDQEDSNILFPIAMSRNNFEICLSVLNK
jgi:hypothetical protein